MLQDALHVEYSPLPDAKIVLSAHQPVLQGELQGEYTTLLGAERVLFAQQVLQVALQVEYLALPGLGRALSVHQHQVSLRASAACRRDGDELFSFFFSRHSACTVGAHGRSVNLFCTVC
mmetsp:Transcript_43363/g.114181  ORF Transcript_43363/g.114181 Transcript_43363/m.114181 type:complete len:119 (-) Transcript_43363:114-470(-)